MATSAAAFAPAPQQMATSALQATANRASPSALVTSKTDEVGNNLAVKNFLESTESSGLLTKVAESGLLSKASKAGFTLSKVESLITLAANQGVLDEVLILAEASGPELIPLLPSVVEFAPAALPLAAAALTVGPGALQGAAVASAGAAYAIVSAVPDDTVVQVAAQTLAAATLGVVVPGACLVGAGLLGKVKSL
jgi:hypothetical protein